MTRETVHHLQDGVQLVLDALAWHETDPEASVKIARELLEEMREGLRVLDGTVDLVDKMEKTS